MKRNYNNEFAKTDGLEYYYNFDYIMHDYMLEEFKIYITSKSNVLEVGCGNGQFTKKLLKIFKKTTVVEASSYFANNLKKKNYKNLEIINSRFEDLIIKEKKYNNIFLIHTLEHVDNRLLFLKNLKKLLNKNGRLFIVVPNAHAISRQIAVKMKLIKKPNSITYKEKMHGHKITFDQISLSRLCKKSKLNIIKEGGIFFKPMANFQIDLALEKKIIDKKYLDACYKLGRKYSNECSSIYTICK